MKFRKAIKEDSESLSKLAYKSKAYWGYLESFMKQCKKDLNITEDYIEEQPVFLVQ
ncbi:GNAT family acetyltransferase [Sutcliffiella horikoshii]|uniref:GNAT family acetyltransferase n=1 Tax=Sutcliffiella horikoshii TaxID=79883 RepID=UPI0021CCC794|nr:GNAT family acetyltransferase [Sutcliffiella horikoshii]